MDTSKLMMGQGVFMLSGATGDWGNIVEITPTGVIVQSEVGQELIRFDNNGTACDSSDIHVDRYKDIVLYLENTPMYDVVDVEKVKAVVSQFNEERDTIPRATCGDSRKFRQHFWENFERLKSISRYDEISGTEYGPWKLYWNSSQDPMP
jgi:hypothetical protein